MAHQQLLHVCSLPPRRRGRWGGKEGEELALVVVVKEKVKRERYLLSCSKEVAEKGNEQEGEGEISGRRKMLGKYAVEEGEVKLKRWKRAG